MRKAVAVLVIACLALTGCAGKRGGDQPSPFKTQVPAKGTKPKLDIDVEHYAVVCEDTEQLPCVMMDEGVWYHVERFDPLQRERLVECQTAGGLSLTYPCVWHQRTSSGDTEHSVFELDRD
jgi:hypothetical protein